MRRTRIDGRRRGPGRARRVSGVALALAAGRSRARDSTRAARAWWIAGAAVLMMAITVQPFRDPDVWWHLALGRLIVEHGIPPHEPFSFLTAANPWIHQQWLYEVGLFRTFSAGSFGPGLASLGMGAVAVMAIVVAALSVPRSARVSGTWLAFAMVLSGLVMGEVVGVRGQVVTLLGTSILLLVITRWREGSSRAVWVLPPTFLLWANLHAGFVVGLIVLAVALAAASPLAPNGRLARRPLLAAAIVSLGATLVNPAGLAIYQYVGETFANPTLTSAITEWLSPDFHNVWVRLFEAEVVLMVILWAIGGGPARFDLLLAGVAVAATLQAQRNVSLYALIAAPQIAAYGVRAWRAHAQPRLVRAGVRAPRALHPLAAATAVLAIGAAVAAGAVVPNITPSATRAFEAARYPRGPANYVAAHLMGQRLYSIDTWGGYLAYRFPSDRMVFLYGETGVFGDRDLQLYEDVHLLASNWTDVLRRYSISHAVIPLHSQEASAFHAIGWTVACFDAASDAVVMSAGSATSPPPVLDAPAGAPRC